MKMLFKNIVLKCSQFYLAIHGTYHVPYIPCRTMYHVHTMYHTYHAIHGTYHAIHGTYIHTYLPYMVRNRTLQTSKMIQKDQI